MGRSRRLCGHGPNRLHNPLLRRPLAFGGGRPGSQQPAKACAAGTDRLTSSEKRFVLDVARLSGVSRPAVWRWQRRYAGQGVDGLLRDKMRKPGKSPLPAKTVAKVLALPCSEPPGNAKHWIGGRWPRPPAKACVRFSASGRRAGCNTTVRLRTFKLQRSRLRRKSRGCGWPLQWRRPPCGGLVEP